jgi:hypothetical protein
MVQLQASMGIWLAVIFHVVTAGAVDPLPEWVKHARQLIGENQGTREQALAALKPTFPNIDALLPELNGPYRNYALDVAVAMRLSDSVQKLLPMVQNDKDGALTLAVNALMDDRTQRPIAEYYMRFLEQRPLHSVAVPVLMAIVDYFTHLRFKCEDGLFSSLLTHPRLEVQQAAALHFAVLDNKTLTKLIKKNYTQLYPQVRAQTVLTFYDKKDLVQAKKFCTSDEDPIVKSACSGLEFKEKRGKRQRKKKRK